MKMRYILIFVCFLLLILLPQSLLHALSYKPIKENIGFPDNFCSGGIYFAEGKWVVFSSSAFCENKIITLSSPLEILPGGNLTLLNTTLKLNGTDSQEANVTVKTGGSVHILDGSHITVGDDLYYRYSFIVEEGASFTAKNSFFDHSGESLKRFGEESGGWWGFLGNNKGLEIFADNSVFENNTVSESYAGGTFYGDYNIIIGNRYERLHKNGLVFNSSNYNNISYNYFYDISYPDGRLGGTETQAIAAYNSTGNVFIGNIVNDSTQEISNNQFENMVGSGIANYDSHNNTLINNTLVAVHVWAFEFRNSHDNVLINNEVLKTHGDGIILLNSDRNIIENFSVGTAEFGVFILGASSNNIKNVIVRNAVELTAAGLRLTSGRDNYIENFKIYDSDSGIILSSRGQIEDLNRNNYLKNIYLFNNTVSIQFDDPYGETLGIENLTLEDIFEDAPSYTSIFSTENASSNAKFINATLDIGTGEVSKGVFNFTYKLDVRVFDQQGGEPLSGVEVKLEKEGGVIFILATNLEGRISPQTVLYGSLSQDGFEEAGQYNLTVYKEDYNTETRTFVMDSNRLETFNLEELSTNFY